MGLEHPILEVVDGLLPLLASHRAAGEVEAGLSSEVVAAVANAGLFRLFAPEEVGGLEASLPIAAEVFESVAAVDPAVAWYMVNSVTVCFTAARLQVEQRDQVFASNQRFGLSQTLGGHAVRQGSGFRLNGEWPVVTGVLDAAWCGLMGTITDPAESDGAGDVRLFLVPAAALEVDKTWSNAVAMRATGSHRAVARDIDLAGWQAHQPASALLIDRPLFVSAASPPE